MLLDGKGSSPLSELDLSMPLYSSYLRDERSILAPLCYGLLSKHSFLYLI
ncbi:unnamed protein product [Prunus brigantina]